MNILKLSLQSLRTDKVRTCFYFLTFLLTTIFIFTFFNIAFQPSLGINLGKDDNSLVTFITVLVIFVAMMCVFIANDFYATNKGKEITVLLMSGASVYQVGMYLFIQSTLIMLLAVPLGILMGIAIVPAINAMFSVMYTGSQNFYVSKEGLQASISIIICEVLWCTYLNVGYCYRNSVQKLKNADIKMALSQLQGKPWNQSIWVLLYVIPILLFIINTDVMSYAFYAIIGLLGVYGLLKHVIPTQINQYLKGEGLKNPLHFIVFGFIRYNLEKIFMLTVLQVGVSVLLMTLVIYHLAEPVVSIIALISYISVMVLLSVTIISKLGMRIQARKKQFLHLSYLGYTKEQLRSVVTKEMFYFFGGLLLLPLLYEIVIIGRVLSMQQMSILLAGILLLGQIIPTVMCFIICSSMYRKMLPK